MSLEILERSTRITFSSDEVAAGIPLPPSPGSLYGDLESASVTEPSFQESLDDTISFSLPSYYLDKIISAVGKAGTTRLIAEYDSVEHTHFRAFHYGLQSWDLLIEPEIVHNAAALAANVRHGVLLIQDIDLLAIETLGTHYKVNPIFFARYLLRRELELEKNHGLLMDKERTHRLNKAVIKKINVDRGAWWHFDCHSEDSTCVYRNSSAGEEEYERHRKLNWSSQYRQGMSGYCTGRVGSVFGCRLDEHLSLILVDAPAYVTSTRPFWNTTLLLSAPRHPATIVLPMILSEKAFAASPRSNTKSELLTSGAKLSSPHLISKLNYVQACLEVWKYLDVVTDLNCDHEHQQIGAGMSYLLAVSTWMRNLDLLDQDIKKRANSNVSQPRLEDFNEWHLRRQNVSSVVVTIRETLENNPDPVLHMHENQFRLTSSRKPVKRWSPRKDLLRLQKQALELNIDLKDLFDVLIGANAVQNSERSNHQAERATTLTWLAFIYLPITAAIGIFGMNIKEINGGMPGWRVVVGGLLILSIPAMLMVCAVVWRKKPWRKEFWREASWWRRKSEADEEQGMSHEHSS